MRSRFTLRRDHLVDLTRAVGAQSAQPLPKGPTIMDLGKYRKAIIAGLGLTVLVLNSVLQQFAPMLSPTWSSVISGVVGVATAVSTYLVPNEPLDEPAGRHAAPE